MRKTSEAARGKWRGILQQFDIAPEHLTGKHTACPACGGRDRFRFDNQRGDGTWICSHCGAGTGLDLLKLVKGWDFKTTASEVDKVLGNVHAEPAPKAGPSDEQKRDWLRSLFASSQAMTRGDQAEVYLRNRVPDYDQQSVGDLRFCKVCPSPDGGSHPALVAVVRDCVSGEAKTLHRTFLDGRGGKALIDRPRALMPTPGALGAVNIQLGEAGPILGIAEGLETALAAQQRFKVPCWAAINTTLMAKWQPPEGVEQVIVFGDCDAAFGGQAAAYRLAHRLSGRFKVKVRIPSEFGTDWADAA